MVELVLLGHLVAVQPLDRLVTSLADVLVLLIADLVLVLDLVVLDGLLHLESIGLQLVLKTQLLTDQS